MTAPRVDRSWLNNLLRGSMLGLGQTGTAVARGVGALPGLGVARDWADETEAAMRDFYDPQGRAGTVGSIGGRILGEGATTIFGGGLATKALSKVAPKAASALTALQQSNKLGRRIVGGVAPVAPIDAVLGAGADAENPLRGAAVNVGLDILGGGVIEGLRQPGIRRAAATKAPLTGSTPEAQRVLTGAEPVARGEPLLRPGQRVRQKVVDDVLAVRELGERLGGGATLGDQASVARGYLGQTDLALGRFGTDPGGQTLRDAMEAAKGVEGDVQAYLRAKRALALNESGMGWKLNASPEDAMAVVRQMEARPEVTAAAADQINGFYRRLLEMRKDAGLVSQEAYDAILAGGDPYVPFVRDFGEEEVGDLFGRGGKGFMSVSGLRRMKAGQASAQIVDAYEQAVLDAQRTFREVGRANVFNTMRGLMAQNPEVAREFIEEVGEQTIVPKTAKTIAAMVDGQQRQFVVKDKDLYEALTSVSPPLQSAVVRLLSVPKEVLRFGVTFLPSFGVANATRDAFFTAGQFAAPVRTALGGGAVGAVTGAALNPDDRAKGAMVGGMIGVGGGAMLPHAQRIAAGVGHALRQDDLYKQWLAEGGAGMGWFSTSRADAAKALRMLQEDGVSLADVLRTKEPGTALKFLSEVVAHPVRAIERFNEVVEQAPRLAKFADEVGSGKSGLRAAAASRDVSVDFARRGADPGVRLVAATEAFWNPKLQGLDKLGRAFNPMTPEGRKAYAIGAATMTAPTIGLFLMNKDNPDYWNVPLWQRNMFWLVPAGQMESGATRFIRVPKPFEPGMMFASVPERMLEWMHQRDPESTTAALKDMVASAGQGLVPVPFGAAIRPAAEASANYDLFRSRNIVNPALQRLPKEEQYDAYTSAPAMLAGEALGVSPKKVDHLIRGYGGSLADVVSREVLTPAAQAAGLDDRVLPARPLGERSRFVARYDGPSSEPVTAIYRQYTKAAPYLTRFRQLAKQDQAAAAAYFREHRDAIATAQALSPATEAFSELSAARKRIENSRTMSAEAKRTALDTLNQRQMTLAQQVLRTQGHP